MSKEFNVLALGKSDGSSCIPITVPADPDG